MDEPTRALLRKDALPVDVFPDHGVLSVTRLDRSVAREASFLDYRTIRYADCYQVSPQDVQEAYAAYVPEPGPSHYLFHIGFCGSTLLSRCLDECAGLRGLREPYAMHSLAIWRQRLEQQRRDLAVWTRLYDSVDKLLRAYAARDRILIKPSDMCMPLMELAVTRTPGSRGVFLYVQAEMYLLAVLRDPTREAFVRRRVREMRPLFGDALASIDPERLGVGASGAVLWWMYMELYARSAQASAVPALDFDVFLRTPAPALRALAGHFGVEATSAATAQALARHMPQYSKHPERAFTAADRERQHDDTRRRHRDEVQRGLKLIEALGGRALETARSNALCVTAD